MTIENNVKPQLVPAKPIKGFRLASVGAAIKYQGRDDMVLMEIRPGASVAAVFTQNAFCAAPVQVSRQHLGAAEPRYLIVNSGNANAGTGQSGLDATMACCNAVAEHTGVNPESVLAFSTGVIGVDLPLDKMLSVVPDLVAGLQNDGWQRAARAIMTTDTRPKACSVEVNIAGETVTVTGMAKGSGMIHPNMATLLAYMATDASVPQPVLQTLFNDVVAGTFNSITVDGDTSTNDSCVLAATGELTLQGIEDTGSVAYRDLYEAVYAVAETLAKELVRDGEGATKLVTVSVEQGATDEESRRVADTVALSPLVKTALFASDPNWGRILAAVGRAGVKDLDITQLEIYLGDVCIVRNGGRDPSYTEAQGQAVMDQEQISIRIVLKRGDGHARVWTCDYSYDYIKINAEYRT